MPGSWSSTSRWLVHGALHSKNILVLSSLILDGELSFFLFGGRGDWGRTFDVSHNIGLVRKNNVDSLVLD